MPVAQASLPIPLFVTVPNAGSGQAKPAAGWPVVIFQHGITRNRTDMLALAPTLAAAGFVTVAIDMPLHGLPVGHPLRINGIERTFDFRIDVPSLDIPVYVVMGRHEARGRVEPAREWFDALDAPAKEWVVFEGSSHRASFERPADYARLLTRVLADTQPVRR